MALSLNYKFKQAPTLDPAYCIINQSEAQHQQNMFMHSLKTVHNLDVTINEYRRGTLILRIDTERLLEAGFTIRNRSRW